MLLNNILLSIANSFNAMYDRDDAQNTYNDGYNIKADNDIRVLDE